MVGGWPALLDATPRQALTFNRSYCDDLCSTDIPLATGVRHDPARVRRLLSSIARNLAGPVIREVPIRIQIVLRIATQKQA